MSDRNSPDDLRSLGERLDKARRDHKGPAADDGRRDGALGGALGLGFRIGLELVVAVVFGLGVGWAFDKFLGTKPWGLIVFVLLGIAAGMLNVFRAMTGMGSAIGYGGSGERGEAAKPAPDAEREEED